MAIFAFCSCHHESGSGNIITEKRQTGNFTGISASAGIEVELKEGATAVSVEADDNLMRFVKTTVEGNTLKIYIGENVSLNDTHIKVMVSAKGIKMLEASSAAEINAKDVLTGVDKITIEGSSAGKVEAEVDAPSVNIESNSAADVHVKGKTKTLDASCSSSGKIDANDLLSENTKVEASSGAEADVHSSVSLNADASSGANINYRGGGNVVKNTSSGGSIDKKD